MTVTCIFRFKKGRTYSVNYMYQFYNTNTVNSEIFARTQFLRKFSNSMPRKFKNFANKGSCLKATKHKDDTKSHS